MKKIFFLCMFLFFNIDSKIRILTFHFNRPDFIKIQHEKFKKFLNEDFDMIVFYDGKTEEMVKQIEDTCKDLGITHIRDPKEIHENSAMNETIQAWKNDFPLFTQVVQKPLNSLKEVGKNHPCIRCCNIIKYALDNYGFNHDDIVILCEGDLFPIREINLRKLCKGFHIVSNIRGKYEYDDRSIPIDYKKHHFGNTIVIIDMKKLPNKCKKELSFDMAYIDKYIADVGGETYYFMKNNKNLKIKKYPSLGTDRLALLPESELKKLNFNEKELDLINSMKEFANYQDSCQFHIGGRFLHYFHSSLRDSEGKERNVMPFLKSI